MSCSDAAVTSKTKRRKSIKRGQSLEVCVPFRAGKGCIASGRYGKIDHFVIAVIWLAAHFERDRQVPVLFLSRLSRNNGKERWKECERQER